MIALTTRHRAFAAAAAAGDVFLAAYTLRDGPMLKAIVGAARRGIKVTVRLDGDPGGALEAYNARLAQDLRRAGVDAALTPALHMKALVCDGVAYLDDRNFAKNGDETIVRDTSPAHVRAIRQSVDSQHPYVSSAFWTSKRDAERAEASMLQTTHAKAVDVETESFGVTGDVYAKLKRLALEGRHCRLIVCDAASPATRRALNLLAHAGVDVRIGSSNEKLAVAGTRAWMGSANATWSGKHDEIDWGMRTRNRPVVDALRTRFEAHWLRARVYRAG